MRRLERTKGVAIATTVALAVAASTFIVNHAVFQRGATGFELTAGTGFSISSTIYSSPACSGTPELLYPGVTRCLVYTVHNPLSVPISVQSISASLDSAYPAPPAACIGSNLNLPNFSGSFVVGPDASANSPGLSISLNGSGTNQDACENIVYHFVYSGFAQYADATSTILSSSLNPAASGQSVTLTATVVAADANVDPTLPTGTVNFYTCATEACATRSLLGSASLGINEEAHFTTSGLPIGTTYVEAIYPPPSTSFLGSTSSVLAQSITSISLATSTSLVASPNPAALGNPVTFNATVSKPSGSASPTGTVAFYLGTPTGPHSLLGSGFLNASASASFATSSLPTGIDFLYAIYLGDSKFAGSTSAVISESVIGPPTSCPGKYSNSIIGNPAFPILNGTNGNDFIYAFGGNYWINGFEGNDCLEAGDGNNLIADGNGDDVVIAGNGLNAIFVGDGNDAISVGSGPDVIFAGNGNDIVTLGNGSHDGVALGGGTDTVSLGTGSYDVVNLDVGATASGTDVVTISTPGSHETIYGGRENATIYLGGGMYNTFVGGTGHNVCHLPSPPSSWHGTPTAYYHDAITNCTVVTP